MKPETVEKVIQERLLELLRRRRKGFVQTFKQALRQMPPGTNPYTALLGYAAGIVVSKKRPGFADALTNMPIDDLENNEAGRAFMRAKTLLDTLVRHHVYNSQKRPAANEADLATMKKALALMQKNGADVSGEKVHAARIAGIANAIAKFEEELAARRLPC